jgi:hypothetical protein
MNSYRFKLALSRININIHSWTRRVYFIFLDPRTEQDLSNEIYFKFFRLQFKSIQIFELARIWAHLENRKNNWMAKGRICPAHLQSTDAARVHSTLSGPHAPAEALDVRRLLSSGSTATRGDVKTALVGAMPATRCGAMATPAVAQQRGEEQGLTSKG